MNNTMTRALSLILAVCMAFSNMTVIADAEAEEIKEAVVSEAVTVVEEVTASAEKTETSDADEQVDEVADAAEMTEGEVPSVPENREEGILPVVEGGLSSEEAEPQDGRPAQEEEVSDDGAPENTGTAEEPDLVPASLEGGETVPEESVADGEAVSEEILASGETGNGDDTGDDAGDTGMPAEPELDPEIGRNLAFDREYIALPAGENAKVSIVGIEPELMKQASVTWKIENSSGEQLAEENQPIRLIDQSSLGATVEACPWGSATETTAFVTATLVCGEQTFKARCRIDILEEPAARTEEMGVGLTSDKATVELYKTDYTEIHVLLYLKQNDISFQNNDNNGRDARRFHNGVAIEEAVFTSKTVAGYFALRVKDDQTLEIIPTETAINGGINDRKFPMQFSSTIQVKGRGWEAETGELKLTIKKTVPKIKATALKFNSFVPNETLPLAFTGGNVSSIRLDTGDRRGCPDWLIPDPENGTLTLADSAKDQKLSGKVWLYVTLDGWTEHLKCPVTVSVSAAKTAPKLTFNPNTLTLNPKAGDVAEIVATVDLAEFRDSAIQFEEITLNNKTYDEGDLICSGVAEDGVITVKTAPGFNAETAKTFKIFYSVAGEKYSFTIKTLANTSTAAPSFTLKASGTIDTGIPGSFVTITVTPKDYITADYSVAIKQYNAESKKYDIGADDLFLNPQWTGNSMTLKQKPAKALTAGKYQVTVSTTVAGETLTKDIVFTVKATDPSKAAPSVTLKAQGKLDVIRPESFITLTPTMKNWYDHELSEKDLIFFNGTGKNAEEITNWDKLFFVETGEKTFTIKLNPESGVNHKTDKYSVGMRDGAKPGSAPLTKSPTALTITMGNAKYTQSSKTVDIVNRDRYSYGTLTLTPTDNTLAQIDPERLDLDKKSSNLLEAVMLGDNRIALHYLGDKVTSDKKISAKISIFLKGNQTTTANATIGVTVNVLKLTDAQISEMKRTERIFSFVKMENGSAWCTDSYGNRTDRAKSGQTLKVVPAPEEGYETQSVRYSPMDRENWIELNEPYALRFGEEDLRIRVLFTPVTKISAETFPDEVLRGAIGKFDTDGNGLLDKKERNAVKTLNCSGQGVTDLRGIEQFPALTTLDCSGNSLTALNLSGNAALTTLNCSGNNLTALNLSGNTALKTLDCSGNSLTALNLSRNTALKSLNCSGNSLTALNLSGNTALTTLNCSGNSLTALNLSRNTALKSVNCSDNNLSSLNLKSNNLLSNLDCAGNAITQLDLRTLTTLKNAVLNDTGAVICDDDTSILIADIRFNANGGTGAPASQAKIFNRPLTLSSSIPTRGEDWRFLGWASSSRADKAEWMAGDSYTGNENATLFAVWEKGVRISSNHFPDAYFRSYVSEYIDSVKDGFLNSEELAAVTEIICSGREIRSLAGIESFPGLVTLDCSGNQLETLNLTKNTALTTLNCAINSIGTLTVSANTKLLSLNCSGNRLTLLDLGKNTALKDLQSGSNPLLTKAVLPNGLQKIDDHAFEGCSALKEIGLPGSLLEIGDRAFYGAASLTEVEIPAGTVSIGAKAYANSGLQCIVIPDSVVTIREDAFDGLSGVEVVSSADAAAKAYADAHAGLTWVDIKEYNSGIDINAANFPDVNFRSFVGSYDTNHNGKLQEKEIGTVVTMNCSGRSIRSLKGIEFFTALVTLDCGNNQMTSLDVSGCQSLQGLSCYSNCLTSLTVNWNRGLKLLSCYDNQLTDLNIPTYPNSSNTGLQKLYCMDNGLTGLDLSACPSMQELNCSGNREMTNLNVLRCDGLKTLDCSGCTSLQKLECHSVNNLTSINASGCTALKIIECFNVRTVESLNVKDCTALEEITCYNNYLTGLDLSGCTALKILHCSENRLTSLDVSKCTLLEGLYCGDNQLTSLDVSKCQNLVGLICHGNQLTNLTLGKKPELEHFDCCNNKLSSVDVTSCPKLGTFWCDGNLLTSVDVSKCKNLYQLYCTENLITRIDIRNCPYCRVECDYGVTVIK